MNLENPYATPQTEAAPLVGETTAFADLSYKQVKKLYNRSRSISAFGYLALIFSILAIITAILSLFTENGLVDAAMFLCIGLFQGAVANGLIARPRWGRILGMIVFIICIFSLWAAIFAIYGLYLVIKTPQLFGPNRLTHQMIKSEFKLRKRMRKL